MVLTTKLVYNPRAGKKIRRWVDIAKSGKWKFAKAPKGKGKPKSKAKTVTGRGGGKTAAANLTKKRKSKPKLLASIGLGGAALITGGNAIPALKEGDIANAGRHVVHDWFPVNPWEGYKLQLRAPPALVVTLLGVIGSALASKFGLNRHMKDMPINL